MPDVQTMLADRFRAGLIKAFGAAHADIDPLIRPSGQPQFGDYQANLAMSLAKTLKQKPRDVAQKVVDQLDLTGIAEKVEIAGPGFVNVHLATVFLGQQAQALLHDERLGVAPASPPQTVVVDYSGPNVAKEMHVGHLRSTVIGDAITRVLEFQGHRVIRQNHLGDWGTQFGMLIEWLARTFELVPLGEQYRIGDLNFFYQNAKQKFDSDTTFADLARRRVVLLQSGDPKTIEMWRWLINESKRHFDVIYRRLDVQLTDADTRAESFYNPMLADVASELEMQGLATISEGALCVFPAGFLGPDGTACPVMVRKRDGGFGYDATDLAALRYRARDLHADRIIYVTDARQKQHFAMVFKVAEMAGWTAGKNVEHVPFGTILGTDNKPFKTRSGEVVKLLDLLNEAEERAAKVVIEKNPDLDDAARNQVAHAVGIGAIKYADLVNDRVKDYVFSWDRMLSFDGNTAPYLQNAYVRIRSIFRKAVTLGLPSQGIGEQPIIVGEPAERQLALKLLQLPGVVEGVAQSLEPHRLCTYLYEVASAFHQFYEKCPVLSAEPAVRDSRLALCDLTARLLERGLGLLGIQVVEQM